MRSAISVAPTAAAIRLGRVRVDARQRNDQCLNSCGAALRSTQIGGSYFFFPVRLRAGTFCPFLRASDRPMAIACLRLLTVLLLRPLFKVPRLRRLIADFTVLADFFELRRAISTLLAQFVLRNARAHRMFPALQVSEPAVCAKSAAAWEQCPGDAHWRTDHNASRRRSCPMTLSTVLLILLILALLGALPSWPYSRGWGYGPSGLVGMVLVVVLLMPLMGRMPA